MAGIHLVLGYTVPCRPGLPVGLILVAAGTVPCARVLPPTVSMSLELHGFDLLPVLIIRKYWAASIATLLSPLLCRIALTSA